MIPVAEMCEVCEESAGAAQCAVCMTMLCASCTATPEHADLDADCQPGREHAGLVRTRDRKRWAESAQPVPSEYAPIPAAGRWSILPTDASFSWLPSLARYPEILVFDRECREVQYFVADDETGWLLLAQWAVESLRLAAANASRVTEPGPNRLSALAYYTPPRRAWAAPLSATHDLPVRQSWAELGCPQGARGRGSNRGAA